eukprot:CAMPEP_0114586688 /NCGR_PEP_ID=MMETSP0125-20121206/9839_1 /TAXON_ID=485358 ORGANISM="Aristerostoma sp., Strain ATCC 50986" /NCGR_SAMPLE_ID=MMETSP0125 /ASSEMBLY_ACC=CAM_ASM_000245 /LENGTH=43 /DNA_ID= /DNA_START= /DNA_END= /DNA_ORIENTATION=
MGPAQLTHPKTEVKQTNFEEKCKKLEDANKAMVGDLSKLRKNY